MDETEAAADSGDWQLVREHCLDVLTADAENEDAGTLLTMAERRLG